MYQLRGLYFPREGSLGAVGWVGACVCRLPGPAGTAHNLLHCDVTDAADGERGVGLANGT